MEKSDKELAVDAAVRFAASWNAISENNKTIEPIDSKHLAELIKDFYAVISKL